MTGVSDERESFGQFDVRARRRSEGNVDSRNI